MDAHYLIHTPDLGPIEAINRANLQAYGRLDSRLIKHITDDNVHVTEEDKTRWDNKADKEELNDLRDAISSISGDSSTGNDSSNQTTSSEYVTNNALYQWYLDNIKDKFVQWDEIRAEIGNVDLSSYLKITDITRYLEDYVTFSDLPDLSKYATISYVTNLINNGGTGLTASQFDYTGNYTQSSDNSYKIGEIKLADTTYPIYGKDSAGTGGNTPILSWEGNITQSTSGSYKLGTLTYNGTSYIIWGKDTKSSSVDPSNPDDDDPTDPGSPSVVTILETDFDENSTEDNILYIIVDSDGNVLYMWLNGNKINIIKSDSSSSTTSERITLTEWNRLEEAGALDPNTVYIVVDTDGSMIGMGINTVLCRIPVPASSDGTIVVCTQEQYTALSNNNQIKDDTIYVIKENGVILKMYLGSTEIPMGSDSTDVVIKSKVQEMFSEKLTFDADGKVKSINWSLIDVTDPGTISATTGFDNKITGIVSSAGFVSKNDGDANNFASLFATEVTNNNLVKKAEIIAAINENESNVTINADKININGILDAKVKDGKSMSQILSDADSVSSRVQTIEDGYMKVTNINQDDNSIGLTAVYTDANETAKTAQIIMNVDPDTSKIRLDATDIQLNANTIWLDGNTLGSGNATFTGNIVAKSLQAGNTGGLHITTDNNNIEFCDDGGEKKAYFTLSETGLLLYMKKKTGEWYCINFANWQPMFEWRSTDWKLVGTNMTSVSQDDEADVNMSAQQIKDLYSYYFSGKSLPDVESYYTTMGTESQHNGKYSDNKDTTNWYTKFVGVPTTNPGGKRYENIVDLANEVLGQDVTDSYGSDYESLKNEIDIVLAGEGYNVQNSQSTIASYGDRTLLNIGTISGQGTLVQSIVKLPYVVVDGTNWVLKLLFFNEDRVNHFS